MLVEGDVDGTPPDVLRGLRCKGGSGRERGVSTIYCHNRSAIRHLVVDDAFVLRHAAGPLAGEGREGPDVSDAGRLGVDGAGLAAGRRFVRQ